MVITPAPEMLDPNSRTRQDLLSQGISFNNDMEVLQWIAKTNVPQGTKWHIIDSRNLPKDRAYRNSWVFTADNHGIQESLELAKPLHQTMIRGMRDAKWSDADAQFNKILEKVVAKLSNALPDDPDVFKLNAAIAQRIQLRNAPAISLDDVTTTDQLRQKLPQVLVE